MAELPAGTITILFTDIAGSTRLWEQHPQAMRAALVEHDALIEFLTAQHGGAVVRPRGEGDSRFCVFRRATLRRASAGAWRSASRRPYQRSPPKGANGTDQGDGPWEGTASPQQMALAD